MEKGGGVGINLRMAGVARPPLRLVIFDCDREGAYEWLQRRGIDSRLQVMGKRGRHVYALLPDDCPDLKSDTTTLNPGSKHPTSEEKPGIDIKTSGLIVAPFSPNKRLCFEGQDLSEDPEAIKAIFESEEVLRRILPVIDPRSIQPNMKLYEEPDETPQPETATSSSEGLVEVIPTPKKFAKMTLDELYAEMSTDKPPTKGIESPLNGVQYHKRYELARIHLTTRSPPTDREHPRSSLFAAACALSRHYFLSEFDAFDLLWHELNPRCIGPNGESLAFEPKVIARTVKNAFRAGTKSPFHFDSEHDLLSDRVPQIIKRLEEKGKSRNRRRKAASEGSLVVLTRLVEVVLYESGLYLPMPSGEADYETFKRDLVVKVMESGFHHLPSNTMILKALCVSGIETARRGKKKTRVIVGFKSTTQVTGE
nr:hypothetical protein [uncultured Holophaga sp.]